MSMSVSALIDFHVSNMRLDAFRRMLKLLPPTPKTYKLLLDKTNGIPLMTRIGFMQQYLSVHGHKWSLKHLYPSTLDMSIINLELPATGFGRVRLNNCPTNSPLVVEFVNLAVNEQGVLQSAPNQEAPQSGAGAPVQAVSCNPQVPRASQERQIVRTSSANSPQENRSSSSKRSILEEETTDEKGSRQEGSRKKKH